MPVILDQTQLEVLMEQMAAGRLFVVHVKLPSVKEGAVATAIVVSDAHVDSIMPRARRAGMNRDQAYEAAALDDQDAAPARRRSARGARRRQMESEVRHDRRAP